MSDTLHTAFLYDRGGNRRIGQFTGTMRVTWQRVRDGVSEASVTFRATGRECCALVEQARTVRHELVIFRGNERVWEGPLIHITAMREGVCTIRARDVLFFTQRCVLKHRWASAYPAIEKVTARTVRILKGEMGPWEAAGANLLGGIVASDSPGMAKTSRVAEKYSGYVWDDMEALAQNSGMDYTVAGRRLLLFDTHELIAMGRPLVDNDFLDGMEVSEYGVELAVRSYTAGMNGKVGLKVTEDDYYGPVELLAQAFNNGSVSARPPTVTELNQEAARNARSRYPAPVTLRVPENVGLAPGVVDGLMPWLVPGTGFLATSDSTCRPMEQLVKLDKVDFVETPTGEAVSVTLSPTPVGTITYPLGA